MPAGQSLAVCHLGAFQGDGGRLLQPTEGLQHAGQGGQRAGEVVDLGDRLGDPARRPELLDASLEVAEEGQSTPSARRAWPSSTGASTWLAIAMASSHSARVAIAGLDHERFAERGQHPRPLGRRWRGGTSATACSYSAIAPWPPVAAR